ncbi:MAG: hypothetical protein U0T73_14035 [Chitinophagales bacterium]
MKSDTSMNITLVVFCVILIGFVFFSSKMNEHNKARQEQLEQTVRMK